MAEPANNKVMNMFAGPRVLSSNEVKAQTRNKCELTRLETRLKQIDKEIEVTEYSRRKELKQIRESMKAVRESTGVTEQPDDLKSTKNLATIDDVNKVKTSRSDSTNSYMFNYELIHKQAEENYGMLYNSFPIKSLQDPIYQYNPTFLRIKDTSANGSNSSSRLDFIDDPDDPDNNNTNENNNDEKKKHMNNSMMNDVDVTYRKGGFKMAYDDTSDEELGDVQILDKYKTELKKYEDNVMITVPYDNDNLEEIYDDLCKAKASIPKSSKEKINEHKNKDPIFAKRYKKFSTAKQSGKVPIFESEKIRLAMPKSAIEKRKKEMMQTIDEKTNLRENPYISEQIKLTEKVNDFVKNLSVN